MHRDTNIYINVDTVKNNIKNIIDNYNYQYYIGVVKGNAYSHGMNIVRYMIDAGINYLAVSNLDEAIEIRKIDKNIPILCLEPINIKYIKEIIKNNVTITINSIDYFNSLKKIKIDKKIKAHLKINSGMNRLGFNKKEDLIYLINNNDMLDIEGVYTHFATSGFIDKYYDMQLANFKDIISVLDLNKIKIIHGFRSLTLFNHPKDDIFNGIRLGISLYGIKPNIKLANTFKNKLRMIKYRYIIKKNNISKLINDEDTIVKESFSFYTKVMQINKIKKGEFVSYGAEHVALKDEVVATLDVGYADGFMRCNTGGYVFINGKRYKIVGDIGMMMISVLVDDSVKVGDTVELIGKNITIREVASRCNTTSYEIYCALSNKKPRI